MKKITMMLIPLLLLVGCSSKQQIDEKATYKDGEYEQKAEGYGGEFVVKAKIKDDRIIDIVVLNHNETPSIGGVALEQMIKEMKSSQSANVDLVSGATVSSEALKEAMQGIIEQALIQK